MIRGYHEEFNDDPVQLTWENLGRFLDQAYTADQIRHVQQIPHGRMPDWDLNKQADQIGYCIRQAQDFFDASAQTGLSTRPLLLYYGIISLAQALLLMTRNGDYAFDSRRREGTFAHNHHGLDIKSELNPSGTVDQNLESLQCAIHLENGDPWGLFGLFYNSLVSPAVRVDVKVRSDATGRVNEIIPDSRTFTHRPDLMQDLSTRIFNVLDLVCHMPDMLFHLGHLHDVRAACLARGCIDVNIEHFREIKNGLASRSGSISGPLSGVRETDIYSIESIHPLLKQEFIDYFSHRHEDLEFEDDPGPALNLRQSITYDIRRRQPALYLTVVDDLAGDTYFVLNPDAYIIEPAAHYIILYCLSIYCRYHPDLWMKTIANTRTAELLESLLNIIYRRFPNMILNQLTRTKYQFRP